MKVKLNTQYCGPRGSFAPGSVIDLPDDEAAGLIEGGYAEADGAGKPVVVSPSPAKDKGKGKGGKK